MIMMMREQFVEEGSKGSMEVMGIKQVKGDRSPINRCSLGILNCYWFW